MAIRPIFCLFDKKPFFKVINTEFKFFPGFSIEQKRKSIESLHNSYLLKNKESNILEISSKSLINLGVQLSAFNLPYKTQSGKMTTVESAFQSSKKFKNGGPYSELLYAPSIVAKKDERLKNSGSIVKFVLEGEEFPNEPKTFFYDWLYVNAVASNSEISSVIIKYDAFSDIEFNPEKSLNCQARSAAIFVSLIASGKLGEALESKENFLSIVYGEDIQSEKAEQLSIF